MIEITPHARKRMEERGITFVVVIYEEEGENVLVITALKVDERRLRRYGFGGV